MYTPTFNISELRARASDVTNRALVVPVRITNMRKPTLVMLTEERYLELIKRAERK